MGRKKGSITVFVTLVLLLVASLLFTMLESARVFGLKAKSDMNSILSLESAFAEYETTLWENYDLLYLDLGYGEAQINPAKLQERILTLNQENLNPKKSGWTGKGTNLYPMNVTGCVVEKYELATDYNGDAFFEQAVEVMEDEIPYQAAQEIYNMILDTQRTEEAAEDPGSKIEDAQNAITSARTKKAEEDQQKLANGETIQPLEDVEDPVKFVSGIKDSGILMQVVENPAELSVKALDLSDLVENRSKQTGTYGSTYDSDFYKKIVYQMYLKEHFGCYTNPLDNRVLDYELEYMIAGKSSDQENLESVVNRILLIREAANLIYLLGDSAKMNEALVIATLLVGFTGNPEIIELVEKGILLAWAYVESIMDIRALLQGGKIPLMKSSEDWVTDIFHISESYANTSARKDNETGMSYEDYLQILLFLTNHKTLNNRVLNLVEKNIRLLSGNPNLCMDSMVQKMTVSISYEASPIFLRLVTIGNVSNDSYSFVQKKEISYLNSE